VMKPKPFASLNHFTVPVAIAPPSKNIAGRVTRLQLAASYRKSDDAVLEKR
jgi:hypothetical protein